MNVGEDVEAMLEFRVYLLQLALSLGGFQALLLNITVGCLPHVVVFYNTLQCFPGQEVLNERRDISW